MTTDDFLLNLRRRMSEYTHSVVSTETITLKNRRTLMIATILVQIYYEIIEYYYSNGIIDESTLSTNTTILEAINRFNLLTDSYLAV
jgi:hypothetical protein